MNYDWYSPWQYVVAALWLVLGFVCGWLVRRIVRISVCQALDAARNSDEFYAIATRARIERMCARRLGESENDYLLRVVREIDPQIREMQNKAFAQDRPQAAAGVVLCSRCQGTDPLCLNCADQRARESRR